MTEPTAGPHSAAAGAKIRQARKNAGLSLTEAAAKSGGSFSAPAMRSWEAGERGLTIDRAVEVANLLGIPPASLMPSEPGDEKPLVLTDSMVDLIIAMGDAFRAQRRTRYALLTEETVEITP